MMLRLFTLLVGLAMANTAHTATYPELEPSGPRLSHRTAQIAAIAREVFPVAVLSVTRGARPDGWVLYVIQLDVRDIPGAPAPVLDIYIAIGPEVAPWTMPGLIRDAAAHAGRIIDGARAHADLGMTAIEGVQVTPVWPILPVLHMAQ